MSKLRVSLFGRFSVAYNDDITDSFHINKVQELFSYLIIHRRPHSRDVLAELLWDNPSLHQSKSYLRKVLWQLNRALIDFAISEELFLNVTSNSVHLNPTAHLWVDVAIFEDAFNHVLEISGHKLKPYQVQELETAVALHQGDLLEGWYQEWCLYERERYQQMLLMMLDKLMRYSEVSGDYETGLVHGTRILGYDPARECAHCGLMRLYYLNGNRTEALRQYERCAAILDKELGVTPTKQTIVLYHQIQGEQQICSSVTPSASLPVSQNLPLLEVLNHLKQVQTNLVSLQQQVQLDIDIVEEYLQK